MEHRSRTAAARLAPLAAVALLAALPRAAAAQSALPPTRVEAGGQIGAARMYNGGSSHRTGSGLAFSLHAGVRVPVGERRALLEGYASRARRADDTDVEIPDVDVAGLGMRLELGRPPAGRDPDALVPYLMLGVARMRADADEPTPCQSGVGRFCEGPTPPPDRTLTALTLGGGLLAPFIRHVAVRAGLHAHKPVGRGTRRPLATGELQTELAIGVTVRW